MLLHPWALDDDLLGDLDGQLTLGGRFGQGGAHEGSEVFGGHETAA